jgi:hypothetical protein
VWVPKVNARAPGWPAPDEYSDNGRSGYYHAPADVRADAEKFGTATSAEAGRGAGELLDGWSVPDWLRSPGRFLTSLSSTARWLVIAGVVLLALYVALVAARARNVVAHG